MSGSVGSEKFSSFLFFFKFIINLVLTVSSWLEKKVHISRGDLRLGVGVGVFLLLLLFLGGSGNRR